MLPPANDFDYSLSLYQLPFGHAAFCALYAFWFVQAESIGL